MGKGIDMARAGAPIHAAVLDDLKDQILVAMVKKYGPVVKLSVTKVFTFEARRKQ